MKFHPVKRPQTFLKGLEGESFPMGSSMGKMRAPRARYRKAMKARG